MTRIWTARIETKESEERLVVKADKARKVYSSENSVGDINLLIIDVAQLRAQTKQEMQAKRHYEEISGIGVLWILRYLIKVRGIAC